MKGQESLKELDNQLKTSQGQLLLALLRMLAKLNTKSVPSGLSKLAQIVKA